MEFNLPKLLLDLPGNIIANIFASLIISVAYLFVSKNGRRSDTEGEGDVIVNSGNYTHSNYGNINNKIYNNNVNNNVFNEFGFQQNQSTRESDEGTILLFLGSFFLIGIILSGTKYLELLVTIPLWCGLFLIFLSIVFFSKQRKYYSVAAKKNTVIAWVVLAVISVAFSASIFAVQNTDSQYSLGHLSQVTERAVSSQDGWLEAIAHRGVAFFNYTTTAEKIGLYIGIFVLAILTGLFITAMCRVLGSMLIPASSDGKIFKSKFLQSLNNNFVNSKWWGYLIASGASLALWFLATDVGAEWLLNLFNQIGEFIQHLAETA